MLLKRNGWLLIPALILWSFSSYCQSGHTDIRQIVEGYFTAKDSVKWIKLFKGYFDDTQPFIMALASDGRGCKGVYKYSHSNDIIHVEGGLRGSDLSLIELDSSENIIGALQGKFQTDIMIGVWYNSGKTLSSNFKLKEVKSETSPDSIIFPLKWIRSYKGLVGGINMEFHYAKTTDKNIRGVAYIENQECPFALKGKFEGKTELSFEISLSNSCGEQSYQLFCKILNEKEMNIYGTDQTGKKYQGTIERKQSIRLNTNSFADYYSAYDILYPFVNKTTVDARIKTIVNDWISEQAVNANNYRTSNTGENITPVRNANNCSAWFEPYYVSDKYLSGCFYFRNNNSLFTNILPVNCYLTGNTVFEIPQLFKINDVPANIREYVRNQALETSKNADANYYKWVQNAEFIPVSIHPCGITFSTPYDPVYGNKTVLVPASMIRSAIKGKYGVKDLFFKKQK